MKVLVVGAGVLGLLTARELAQAGCEVEILERGEVGREASWAGGGIVSPLYPWRYPEAVTALSRQAQRLYPELAASLLSETGCDIELFRCGMLMLEPADMDEALTWSRRQSSRMKVLSAPELDAFDWLQRGWRQGLWMPEIANVRNPRLLAALRMALERAGVRIHEHAELKSWERQESRIVAAVTAGARFGADAFVVCGGAWSPALLHAATPSATALPVQPVRGQMLLYRLEAGALPCIVLAQGRYVIPRRDGHVLCGSTLEYVGFDKATTEEAYDSLRASAELLLPALRGQRPVAHWAGLRPGSPQGIPFIGREPRLDNLWVNTGHFRNGLVLAPAASRLLADQLLGRPAIIDPGPYQR